MPLFECLLAGEPRHVSARYRRGCLRIAPGDDAVIHDLERVMDADPSIHNYVPAFETPLFTLGDKGTATARSLAALEWPMAMLIVHLVPNPCKRFRKTICNQSIAPIEFRTR